MEQANVCAIFDAAFQVFFDFRKQARILWRMMVVGVLVNRRLWCLVRLDVDVVFRRTQAHLASIVSARSTRRLDLSITFVRIEFEFRASRLVVVEANAVFSFRIFAGSVSRFDGSAFSL